AIPTLPLLRGSTPFSISPWVLETQRLVPFRCLASPPVTSTPLLALDRLISIKEIQIQPLAPQRFCLTPPAQKTQPWEQPLLNLTAQARGTLPLEHSHSLIMLAGMAIRLSERMLFLTTRQASLTRRSALVRSLQITTALMAALTLP